MSVVIQVDQLSRHFRVKHKPTGLWASLKALWRPNWRTIKAVDQISFQIKKGEIVGLIGPNGAGKTTTMKLLSGLLYPTTGQIKVLGYTPFTRQTKFLRSISLVMGQKNQLFWDLPAIESFRLQQQIYHIDSTQFAQRLSQLTRMLQLSDLIYRPVRKLSLGQRMKCELVAALLHNPQILFLDEPTIGLDIISQHSLWHFIQTYNQSTGATVVLTSHYMKDVQQLCQRVLIINQGKIRYDGTLGHLIKRHANYKQIKLTFATPVTPNQLSIYPHLVESNDWQAVFSIPRAKISHITAEMLQTLPVADLDITEPPIEHIIARIFSDTKTSSSPN